MKIHSGVWLPDSDDHFENHLGNGPVINGHATYQFDKFTRCLPYLRSAGIACDIGAGIGLWSRVLAGVFDRVIAFEASPEYSECHVRNCTGFPNISLHHDVLGHQDDDATSRLDGVRRFRGKSKLDLIRISTGSDAWKVVKGAERTIKQSEPCILIDTDEQAIELLENWGMVEQWRQSGSHLMVWCQK